MKNIPLVITFLLMLSCRYREIKNEFPAINDVAAGKKFRITLPEEHKSGYLWQLQHNFDTSVVNALNEVWHGNEKGIDFNLIARATGQTTLTFVKRKYRDTSEIRQFVVKIADH